MFNGLLLSLDSLIGSLGLGLLTGEQPRRTQLCLLFGLCDGLGTIAGWYVWRDVPPLRIDGQASIAALGLCVWVLFVGILIYTLVVRKCTRTVFLSLVPVFFSADNFLAGAAFRPHGHSEWSAAEMAVSGVVLAATGFGMAEIVRRRLSKPMALCLGAILLLTIFVV